MKKTSRIYIAGHTGFIGKALTRRLKGLGYKNLILKTHKELDLTQQGRVDRLFSKTRPEYVFLLAAKVGGIYANNTYPAEFIYQNLAIQTNVIHASYKYGAKKLIFPGSACMYPKHCPQPMEERHLLTGLIEPTNEPFAIAKIAGIKMCQAYNRQYNTNFISVVPATVFGPGDHFNKNGHVVAGLIERFHDAKRSGKKQVTIWGTGKPKREFIFIDDVVEALIFIMKNCKGSQIINIGTGVEVSVKDVAEMIKKAGSFKGDIVFDKARPDGIPRRLLDSKKLSGMHWRPGISLKEAVSLTYNWYKDRGSCG